VERNEIFATSYHSVLFQENGQAAVALRRATSTTYLDTARRHYHPGAAKVSGKTQRRHVKSRLMEAVTQREEASTGTRTESRERR